MEKESLMKRFAAILIVMAMLLPLLVSCGGNEAKPTGTDTPHSGEDKQDTGKQVATADCPNAMLCYVRKGNCYDR